MQVVQLEGPQAAREVLASLEEVHELRGVVLRFGHMFRLVGVCMVRTRLFTGYGKTASEDSAWRLATDWRWRWLCFFVFA